MEKTFSSLIFCKHGAVDDFHGAIVISFQIREIRGGGGGRVSRHPRSGKVEVVAYENLYVNKHATCDLKYPQFPYCELCDNKQSNHRPMNVLFCTRALFPDVNKSSK